MTYESCDKPIKKSNGIDRPTHLIVLILTVICFSFSMWFLITLTKIERGGVKHLTPDYIETYQCKLIGIQ